MELRRSERHGVKTGPMLPRYVIPWAQPFFYVGFCLDDAASSQESIGNALLATEVGVRRDRVTVDRTTNLLNQLMYKVQMVSLHSVKTFCRWFLNMWHCLKIVWRFDMPFLFAGAISPSQWLLCNEFVRLSLWPAWLVLRNRFRRSLVSSIKLTWNVTHPVIVHSLDLPDLVKAMLVMF